MSLFGSEPWMYSSGSEYTIEQSLRFNYDTSNILRRTPTAVGNRKKFTISFWAKMTSWTGPDDSFIWVAGQFTGGQIFALQWKTYNAGGYNGKFLVIEHSGTGRFTEGLIVDTASWYHICVAVDTDLDNGDDRIICYINGVRQPLTGALIEKGKEIDINTPAYNQDWGSFNVGSQASPNNIRPYSGYIAEAHFIDGQQLDANYFGEVNEDWGHWVPKRFDVTETPEGTYGVNGYYLDFSQDGTYQTASSFQDTTDNYSWSVASGQIIHTTSFADDLGLGGTVIGFDTSNSFNNTSGGLQTPNNSVLSPNGSNTRTFEAWVRLNNLADTRVWHGRQSDWYQPAFGIQGSTGKLYWFNQSNGGANLVYYYSTNGISANTWHHIAVTINNKTVTFYIDGQSNGSYTFSSGTWSPSGTNNMIGAGLVGFMSDIRISDNIRYTGNFTPPSTLHELDSNTLALIQSDEDPITSMGADQSGKGNHFNTYNLFPTDVVPDSPSNNFAIGNVLAVESPNNGTYTVREGGLRLNKTSSDWQGGMLGTISMKTGKWYWEVRMDSTGGYNWAGLIEADFASRALKSPTDIYNYMDAGYQSDSRIWTDNGQVITYSTSTSSGGILAFAYDADNKNLWLRFNGGSWYNSGNPGTGANPTWTSTYLTKNEYLPIIHQYGSLGGVTTATSTYNFGQDSSFAGEVTRQNNTDSNGIGDFYYSVPNGFLALCTANLPEPAINPKDHFNTVLYGGTGASLSVTGVGFKPDLNWIAGRSFGDFHIIHDSVRGVQNSLRTQQNIAQTNYASSFTLSSFDADGFTVGTWNNINRNDGNHAAWNWKADGTSGSTNTNGSITTTVSANQDAGFSIFKYTGNGSNSTIGHGLTKAPEFIIIKCINQTANWMIWHKDLGSSAWETWGGGDLSVSGGSPSKYIAGANSSTISIGTDIAVNQNSSYQYVGYAWHSVDDYCKVGTYYGTGQVQDGAFVHTGFKPAFVLLKNNTSARAWHIYDNKRDAINSGGHNLRPASLAAEIDESPGISFTSNGFKIDNSWVFSNGDNNHIYYIAFAERPFKYSNAHMSTYDKEDTVAPSTNTINQSLRFVKQSSTTGSYLTRTFSAAGNRQKMTVSFWMKRGLLGRQTIFHTYNVHGGISITSNDTIQTNARSNEAGNHILETSMQLRDPSAWYHVVWAIDTTSLSENNRQRLYVNGKRVEDFTTEQYPGGDYTMTLNNAAQHMIGQYWESGFILPFDGYLSDFYFIDGQGLGPEHFGYNDPTYGDWRPKAYEDGNPEPDFGGTGFHLEFASGAVGDDSSSLNNHWSLNNISTTTDAVPDSPTNNFATLNPLYWNKTRSNKPEYSEGNLKGANVADCMTEATMAVPPSGKWYYEARTSGDNMFGWGIPLLWGGDTIGGSTYGVGVAGIGIHANGRWLVAGSYTTDTGVSFSSGTNIIQIALDLDNNKIYYGKNGSWTQSGNPANNTGGQALPSNLQGKSLIPAFRVCNGSGQYSILNFGQDSSFAGEVTAQGNQDSNGEGDFYYTPPTGFLALCNNNLPNPTVVPKEHFNTTLHYGGTSIVDSGLSNVDLVWVKARNVGYGHGLLDKVRGEGLMLSSNTTTAETSVNWLTWDGDGSYEFSTSSNINHVFWNWKANGSGVSNSDGSITSTVSANQDAGFSIVKVDSLPASTLSTFGHGLGAKPDFIIFKSRNNAANWDVYHSSLTPDGERKLYLNDTSGEIDSGFMGDTPPTSSVISFNPGSNSSNHIAYCFRSIDGFSKFGSYIGNGSTDGPFTYTGFRPAFVLLKDTTSGVPNSWWIYDNERSPYNLSYNTLHASDADAEETYTGYGIDILSNGFKNRASDLRQNASGRKYIYAAFAEYPFKRTNSR